MVYPTLLPLMRTPRLSVVDWTDAPADLNELVRFAERRNRVSFQTQSTNLRCTTSKKSEGLCVILSSDVPWPIEWNKCRYMSNEESTVEHKVIRFKWFSLFTKVSEKQVGTFCGLTVSITFRPVAGPLNLLHAASNFYWIWSACGQHEILYT